MNILSLIIAVLFGLNVRAASDPLPSWNQGDVKQSIIKFVEDVTKEGGSFYVKPEDRIATFDNDGTLWSEVPTVEVEFTKARYKSLGAKVPTTTSKLTQKQILEIMAKTHSGMSEEVFAKEVQKFFAEARHPKWGVPYSQTNYKPMVELLSYLRRR